MQITTTTQITGPADTYSVFPIQNGYGLHKHGMEDGRVGLVAFRTRYTDATALANRLAHDTTYRGGREA